MDFRTFLQESISKRKAVIFDGGMGTMIQASGVTDYDIPEDLNISHPDLIRSIHAQYLEAGANVLTGNTFGANPIKLGDEGSYTAEEYITRGVQLQLEAIKEAEAKGNTEPHFASWDTGQIGKLLEPMGSLTFDQAYESYKTACMAAEKAGAQVAIIETMSDLYEMKAAILAVKENTKMAIVATATFQSNLRTLTGADVQTCVTYLEALGVDVLGFNCGGSLAEGEELTRQFCRYAHKPVLIQPNAGLPVVQKGKTIFLVRPDKFAQSQLQNRQAGAALLGGCCGTTPEHIKAMRDLVEESAPVIMPSKKDTDTDTFICSYNRNVQIGSSAGPQIIGERINPTGKKKCQEALRNHDMQFILDEAESQINAGAQILDVNVGLPGIDEKETMVDAVKTIQAAFATPLQIDSSEAPVLEKALRYYNGKALVNSVNGRQDVMDKVLPLVAHYGGSLVALCIDEEGIAPTAEGRVKVAKKIIKEAAKYGIPVRDLVIDTLTLTVSSQQKEALETLKAIEMLRSEYGDQGIRFVLGVSNISFGLPRRDIVNSRFFAMALYAGLDACIINPLMEPMMESYRAYRSLAGFDQNCLNYIETYTDSESPYAIAKKYAAGTLVEGSGNGRVARQAKVVEIGPSKIPEDASEDEKSLIEIICKGFKDQSASQTKKMLEGGTQPVSIIDRCIVPALDLVGQDFEKGKKFLPQLLLSADTVSAAFEVIKAHLAASGTAQESKGTIVIATVFGDIHDIGKNIVKAMLENYGFTVIDLGKNVPADRIVETVLENDIQLVGLSALMTTTVANMEDTIKKLHSVLEEKHKSCKIMVGGAVLTPDYATQIGADYYGKDAMASVAIAKEVFGA